VSSSYADQLAGATGAVSIREYGFSWFGERPARPPASTWRALSPQVRRAWQVRALQDALYAHFYCTGRAVRARRPMTPELSRHTTFAAELVTAAGGGECWESGWALHSPLGAAQPFPSAGQVVVEKRGVRLWVRPGECRVEAHPDPGDGRPPPVAVLMPRVLPSFSPGFILVLGDREPPGTAVTRVYWNLFPDAAAAFLRIVRPELDDAGVRFRLKVARDPALYARCDSGVLYLAKDDFAGALPLVRSIHDRLRGGLRHLVPSLTKRLAPGISVADEPGTGESFGQNRCRLIAEALVHAHQRGVRGLDARLAAVAGRFAQDGISLDRPYAATSAGDDYAGYEFGDTAAV
jgi:hypothetical protein